MRPRYACRALPASAAAFVALVTLAACGSSSKPAASTTPTSAAPASSVPTTPPTSGPASTTPTTAAATGNFNSCSVVTQAQAAAAIGGSVTPGVLGTATVEGGLACVFYGPTAPTPRDPNVAQTDSVRVVVVEGADALKWYNDYKSKVAARAVSGFGDSAYYDGYASISILKGDAYLRIAVAPPGAPPSLSDEEHLAGAILPNI